MRILLISYYYPPMGGAGVQRALKFSKYLPAFGVQPVVLAAEDPGYVGDASLADEIPASVAVHRVAHRPLLQTLVRRWRGAWGGHSAEPRELKLGCGLGGPFDTSGRTGVGARRAEQSGVQTENGAARTMESAACAHHPVRSAASSVRPEVSKGPRLSTPTAARKARARDALLRAYASLQFPDDKSAWARRALREARRILRSEPIDLIFSSAPPVSAHALGARLSREFGVPWVADYRDLWTEISSHNAPAWRRALDRRIESNWLQQAAGVVTVTPSWARMLAQRLGSGCPVAFIPNGYDEADFVGLPAPRYEADHDFTLVHTGTFYGPRDPGAFLDGVALYLQQASAPSRRLRVRLVGNIGARFDERLRQFDAEHPGVVERVPYLPHREALAELVRANALLLVIGGWQGAGGAGLLPGKIFEYLRAAKPVLLIGPEKGDAAELVRRHASGHIVDESPQRIAQALTEMVNGEPADARATRDGVGCFERRELSRQLADFLTRCREAHERA